MTNISVSTGPLAAAAPRLQAQGRAAEQRAHGVEAVLRGLDLEIRAREHFDARLRTLSGQLSDHAQHLTDHARFLTFAAGRYEGADAAAQQGVPADRTGARGEAPIGAFRAEQPGRRSSWWEELSWDSTKPWLPLMLGLGGYLIQAATEPDPILSALKYVKTAEKSLKLTYDLLDASWRDSAAGMKWLKNNPLKARLQPNLTSYGLKPSTIGKFGTVLNVVTGVYEGWKDLQDSAGSMTRRVSNGVFTAGSSITIGLVATAVAFGVKGMIVGAGAGTVVPGPGNVVGAAIGFVAGVSVGVLGDFALKSPPGQAAKKWVGDKAEEALGDVQTVVSGYKSLVGGNAAVGQTQVVEGLKGLVTNPLVGGVLAPPPLGSVISIVGVGGGVSGGGGR